jgi:D-threo-aldose 1-dehydrogenase
MLHGRRVEAMPMQQRRLGRTGLQVSEFTLGGGIVGGILINETDEVRHEALDRVIAAGCNWIDTAADYGKGESERGLGRLLSGIGHKLQISTKVRIDPSALDDLEGQIRRSLEESLNRLRTDRVALFQLHNQIGATTERHLLGINEILRPGGVADIFDRLRGEGYFGHHGLTALGETAAIVEVLRSGRFDTAQVYYNMLNPSAARSPPAGWRGQDFAGVIAACRAQDMGIMNIRVLAAGVLASDTRHGREVVVAADATLEQEAARARAIFDRLGTDHGTRAQAAIRFALANPDLSTVVVGLATLDQLDEALAAFEAGPLPDAALARIDAGYG